jgi:signal peptidase I
VKTEDKKESKTAITVIICVGTGILIGLFLKLFVFDVLHIQGTSMQPALRDGGTVVVNKLAYGIVKPFSDTLITEWAQPQPGDIIIFLYNNKIVIKRCVAVGGTPLEYSTDSGYTLHVGTKTIPLTGLQYHRMMTSTVVPEGTILAVGDNYALSIDSRTYGFVPVKNVIGKVLCR